MPSRRASCLELEWRINERRVRSPTVREGNFRKAPSLTVGLLAQRDREYTQPNLNERLISCGNLVAGLEDVAFTATRVQQFHRMLVVDLLAQPVHINLDRI